MRPIQRGSSPQTVDFSNYEDAKPYLVSRIGRYCSYCERPVLTNLAVEHIQPKGIPAYAPLVGSWHNFLLACVNCNSTKKNKDVILSDIFFPDRDNTFAAFEYSADGQINASCGLTADQEQCASRLLRLVGLDKPSQELTDENAKQVALDRVAQRIEVWGIAVDSLVEVNANPGCIALRNMTVCAAKGHGFFSIWMTVFSNDLDMRVRLIEGFSGTSGSGCFNLATSQPISPAPNPDALSSGGKV